MKNNVELDILSEKILALYAKRTYHNNNILSNVGFYNFLCDK